MKTSVVALLLLFGAVGIAGAADSAPVTGKALKLKLRRGPLYTPPGDPAANNPPPAGAILDLNGQTIPGGGNGTTFQQYSTTFVAGIANTAITIALRDDPAFISLERISVTDVTHPGGNVLLNGDFTGGVYTNNGNSHTPVSWTFANQYGAGASGVLETPCSHSGGPTTNCWYDGSVGSYDAISQTITTTIGDTYQLSFYLSEDSGCGSCSFTRLSNGSEDTGIDVTAYAQAGLPAAGTTAPTTPVPPTFWLMAAAVGLLAMLELYRRRLARNS